MNKVTAAEVVHRVICKLNDRAGFDHWWDSIEEYERYRLQEELEEVCIEVDS